MNTFVRNPWLPENPNARATSESQDSLKLVRDLEARLFCIISEWPLWAEAEKCVKKIKTELERLGVPSKQINSIGL